MRRVAAHHARGRRARKPPSRAAPGAIADIQDGACIAIVARGTERRSRVVTIAVDARANAMAERWADASDTEAGRSNATTARAARGTLDSFAHVRTSAVQADADRPADSSGGVVVTGICWWRLAAHTRASAPVETRVACDISAVHLDPCIVWPRGVTGLTPLAYGPLARLCAVAIKSGARTARDEERRQEHERDNGPGQAKGSHRRAFGQLARGGSTRGGTSRRGRENQR